MLFEIDSPKDFTRLLPPYAWGSLSIHIEDNAAARQLFYIVPDNHQIDVGGEKGTWGL